MATKSMEGGTGRRTFLGGLLALGAVTPWAASRASDGKAAERVQDLDPPGYFGTVVSTHAGGIVLRLHETSEEIEVRTAAGARLGPGLRADGAPKGLAVFEPGERVVAQGARRRNAVVATSVIAVPDAVEGVVGELGTTQVVVDGNEIQLPKRYADMRRTSNETDRRSAEALAPAAENEPVMAYTRRTQNGPVLVAAGSRTIRARD